LSDGFVDFDDSALCKEAIVAALNVPVCGRPSLFWNAFRYAAVCGSNGTGPLGADPPSLAK
jgi:hypothetical protein